MHPEINKERFFNFIGPHDSRSRRLIHTAENREYPFEANDAKTFSANEPFPRANERTRGDLTKPSARSMFSAGVARDADRSDPGVAGLIAS